jgi:hypothetical protein
MTMSVFSEISQAPSTMIASASRKPKDQLRPISQKKP